MTDAWNGVPENPERDGWHWIAFRAGEGDHEAEPFLWHSEAQRWEGHRGFISPKTIAVGFYYVAPVVRPSDLAAREAAAALAMREGAEAKCEDLRAFGDGAPKSESGNAVAWARAAESLRDQIAAIPVPHADALDALLAKAREEGKREAAKRMHYAEAVIAALCDPWGGMEKVSNEVRDAVRAWRALLTGGPNA